LLTINALNRHGSGNLAAMLPAGSEYAPPTVFLDVNGDGFMAPNDVLIVINYLNTSGSEGEGEGSSLAVVAPADRVATSFQRVGNWLTGAAERVASLLDQPAKLYRRLPATIDLPTTASEYATATIDEAIASIAVDQQARKEAAQPKELDEALDDIFEHWQA
jgi:hypothetical protein